MQTELSQPGSEEEEWRSRQREAESCSMVLEHIAKAVRWASIELVLPSRQLLAEGRDIEGCYHPFLWLFPPPHMIYHGEGDFTVLKAFLVNWIM